MKRKLSTKLIGELMSHRPLHRGSFIAAQQVHKIVPYNLFDK